MLLAQLFVERCHSRQAAYNSLQAALMTRYLRRGGTVDSWMTRFAPVFRKRYGWICQEITG